MASKSIACKGVPKERGGVGTRGSHTTQETAERGAECPFLFPAGASLCGKRGWLVRATKGGKRPCAALHMLPQPTWIADGVGYFASKTLTSPSLTPYASSSLNSSIGCGTSEPCIFACHANITVKRCQTAGRCRKVGCGHHGHGAVERHPHAPNASYLEPTANNCNAQATNHAPQYHRTHLDENTL